jgi:4-hydroxy-tetrahydrodipicolinate reductase
MKNVKIISYGVGVIGKRLVTYLLKKEGIKIVGAVDINPEIVGKDLGEVIGQDKIGVIISDDAEEVLEKTKPDIVCHTTMSFLRQTFDQFKQILEHGVDIVSTCEELAYPYATEEGTKYAEKLDNIAKKNNATILGTGINPGFLMDTLPIILTGPCKEVKSIYITRQMNAATRRIPFQKKIGAGMTKEEFIKAIDSGKITGHVGLEQSIQMIADTLGWNLEEIKVDSPETVILDHDVASDAIKVFKGINAGTKQMAYGVVNGQTKITMDFRAYIGATEEFDSIDVHGVPVIHQKIIPCVHGDHGTIAVTTNMIPHVLNSEPGLKTMADLPIVHATPVHFGKYVRKK